MIFGQVRAREIFMEGSIIALLGRQLFLVALIGYGLCVLAYLAYALFPKHVPKSLPTIILTVVSIINVGIVILKSIESQRSPFSNRYESITFFGMVIGIIYLLNERKLKVNFGGLIASLIAFGLFFFMIWFSINSQGVPFTFANITYLIKQGGTHLASRPLMPALQSPWFFWHVSLAFLGYALFTTGFVLELTSACISVGRNPNFYRVLKNVLIALAAGVVLLIIGDVATSSFLKFIAAVGITVSVIIILGMLIGKRHVGQHAYDDDEMKRLSSTTYTYVLFAFPLLTWCVVSGGAWADKAWGTYWGWDPKEIWSLITWMIYACYFHFKGHPQWKGKAASVVHVIAFISVLTTYLMVDYLVKWFEFSSLHSYMM